jgi:hypothetical protein
LLSHDRDDVFAGHDRAAQVDGADPVESLLGKSSSGASPPAMLTPTL